MRAKSLATHSIAAVIAAAVVGTAVVSPISEDPAPHPPDEIHFAPGLEPLDALVRHLDGAKETIRIQERELTSIQVAAALVRARVRGVDVRVLLDRSGVEDPPSWAGMLTSEGVIVACDAEHSCYDAAAVIDDATPRPVVCLGPKVGAATVPRAGSSLLVSRSPETARAYRQNWERHARHSAPVRTLRAPDGPEPGESPEMAREADPCQGPIGVFLPADGVGDLARDETGAS
jgi:hypothetical protein